MYAPSTSPTVTARTVTRADILRGALGVWACPNCPGGWEQYMIATDAHVCIRCGYKGGELDTDVWQLLADCLNPHHPRQYARKEEARALLTRHGVRSESLPDWEPEHRAPQQG